jgi:sec-independent protein translocase protein TatA
VLGDLFDSPWKLLIIAVVLIILFGGKKMPDAARSLGRSMRILKAEVKDLHGDHEHAAETPQQVPPMLVPQAQQIDQLQQQIRDLQQQVPAGQTVTASGWSAADAARTQQPG